MTMSEQEENHLTLGRPICWAGRSDCLVHILFPGTSALRTGTASLAHVLGCYSIADSTQHLNSL